MDRLGLAGRAGLQSEATREQAELVPLRVGLVVQELLLRDRARTVLVVCPAPWCVKWRDEMAEKFGLAFRIVDAECLHQLRRSRGPYVNPWTHFPRLITSIDWLKRDRPLQLLRTFDLLIVDEVHGCAPSGRGRYATDSLRTAAIRRIAPHFEHRLFLSATRMGAAILSVGRQQRRRGCLLQ